jgi:phosphopantothenate synthetase
MKNYQEETGKLKRKNTVSKHDIIRALKNMLSDIQTLGQRLAMMERILFNYVEMKKDDKKLMKYIEKTLKKAEEQQKKE